MEVSNNPEHYNSLSVTLGRQGPASERSVFGIIEVQSIVVGLCLSFSGKGAGGLGEKEGQIILGRGLEGLWREKWRRS